jgi:hypothetical protein
MWLSKHPAAIPIAGKHPAAIPVAGKHHATILHAPAGVGPGGTFHVSPLTNFLASGLF